jgi:haloacetate dehalogenase
MNDFAQTIYTPRGQFFVRDTQQGAPVVLLHGWPQSSYCWQGLLPHFDPSWRLVRPDLRGMGDSERTPGQAAYAKHELAADVLAVLDKLGIDEFCLAGHDWGGAVAQEVAWLAPHRVKKLAIINILIINNLKGNLTAREVLKEKGVNFSWYQAFLQQPELPERMIPGNEEVWLRHFLRLAHHQPFPPTALAEYVRTFQVPGTAATTANYYRMLPTDTQRWATYAGTQFTMPALYLHGQRDVVIIPAYLQHADECFAQLTSQSLDGGHFILEERPAEVAEALGQFFADAQS